MRTILIIAALVTAFMAGSVGKNTTVEQPVFVEWRTPIVSIPNRLGDNPRFWNSVDVLATKIPASAFRGSK